MTKNIDKLLAKILMDKGLIDQGQLDGVVAEVEKTMQPFSAILIEQGLIKEDKLLNILAEEMKIAFVNLKDFSIEKSLITAVPLRFAKYYKSL